MERGFRDLNGCLVRGGDEYEFLMNKIMVYSFQLSIYDDIVSIIFWLKTTF